MKHNTLALLGEAINTADATLTPLSTFSTVPSKVYLVTARVVAINATDLTQGAGYILYGTFRTDAAGVITQVGSTAATATMEDNAAWTATMTVSQTDVAGNARPEIRINATGAAATSVNWRTDVTILKVGVGPEMS